MKNFLITGGAGFVGSHLAEELLKKGNSVTILDNLITGKRSNLKKIEDKINFIKGDIRDQKLLENICSHVDGIFHQAAKASVPESFDKPKEYHDVNVVGTENIFKLAKKNNFKVVYASSSSVYGHKEDMPVKEESERNPINPYGQTKLDDEYLFEKYSKDRTKIIGLRYFNIFGKGQTLEYAGVITKFLDRINQKQPPIIFGDGSQLRDFISVEDIVLANLAAMESKISKLLVNVGTGNAITILELANMMIDISGLEMKPIFETELEGDIKKSQADISLITKSFNWKAKKDLREWLMEII